MIGMPRPAADIEHMVDAASRLLELPIAAGHRPGVLAFFALAAQMADRVAGVPLGVEDESGAVFRPVEPHDPRDPAGALTRERAE